jgi:2-polyprenyl-3-methyl-5-hydroxy-6-metoxy-1,4-benzoquinol methylase
MDKKKHWDGIYGEKTFSELTWFQPEAKVSVDLIDKLDLSKESSILDVGGGASTLIDSLIEKEFKKITVLDLSENALKQSQKRIGEKTSYISWCVGDVIDFKFNKKFDLWHDRAVFHFLTQESEQEKYISNLEASTKRGSHFIISTFAEDGPLKCSGLEIVRYSKDNLVDKFSAHFECIEFKKETHTSPTGMEQKFNYWVFRKK